MGWAAVSFWLLQGWPLPTVPGRVGGVRVSKKERKLESQISFLKPQDVSTEGLRKARLHPTL